MKKLVRDLIPVNMKKIYGRDPDIWEMDSKEFLSALLDKLVEEAKEVRENPSLEEMADITEVLIYLKKELGYSNEEIEVTRNKKKKERGGFDRRILLTAPSASKDLDNVRFIQKCFVINDEGKILALKRAPGDDKRAEKWDLPGGRLEVGEEVLSAIKREIKEEVGLIAGELHPVHVASGTNFANSLMMGQQVFAVCYICNKWKGELTLSNEHTEYKWLSPEEFSRLDFGNDGGFFEDSLQAYLNLGAYTNAK